MYKPSLSKRLPLAGPMPIARVNCWSRVRLGGGGAVLRGAVRGTETAGAVGKSGFAGLTCAADSSW